MDFATFFKCYGTQLYCVYSKAVKDGATETFSRWVLKEYGYYLRSHGLYEVPYIAALD